MSIKNLFSKEQSDRNSDEDYKITYSKSSIIIMAVISLVCALIIWTIAVYSDSSTHTFTTVPIEVRSGESIASAEYRIIDYSDITFEVRGRNDVISVLDEKSVIPYIDLNEISDKTSNGDGTYTLPIRFDTEANLFVSWQGVTHVTIDLFMSASVK